MMGIISDIHGNYEALKEVVGYFDTLNIKKIVCLGDIVGYYSQVNECCDLIREREAVCLLGNHDWYMLAGSFCPRSQSVNDCLAYQRNIITNENKKWLTGFLPFYQTDNVSMVHGGWTDPIDEYIQPEEEYFNKIEGRIFVSGHTHIQKLCKYENKTYLNPGSVGQPRDGDPRAAFAIMDGENIELKRIEYDYKKTGQLMQEAGFSGYYYECLYGGDKKLGYYKV